MLGVLTMFREGLRDLGHFGTVRFRPPPGGRRCIEASLRRYENCWWSNLAVVSTSSSISTPIRLRMSIWKLLDIKTKQSKEVFEPSQGYDHQMNFRNRIKKPYYIQIYPLTIVWSMLLTIYPLLPSHKKEKVKKSISKLHSDPLLPAWQPARR